MLVGVHYHYGMERSQCGEEDGIQIPCILYRSEYVDCEAVVDIRHGMTLLQLGGWKTLTTRHDGLKCYTFVTLRK